MIEKERFLKFQGFHPSDFTRSYVNEKIQALHEEAPYGATIKAVFTRKEHQFKGAITIYSSAGKFFAVASGKKLKEVNRKLMEQMRKQIGRWKSKRFWDNHLGDPNGGHSFSA